VRSDCDAEMSAVLTLRTPVMEVFERMMLHVWFRSRQMPDLIRDQHSNYTPRSTVGLVKTEQRQLSPQLEF